MKRLLDEQAVAPEVRRLLAAGQGSSALPGAARLRSRARVAKLAALPAAAGAFFWLQQFAIGAGLGTALSLGVAAANGRFTETHARRTVPPVASETARTPRRPAVAGGRASSAKPVQSAVPPPNTTASPSAVVTATVAPARDSAASLSARAEPSGPVPAPLTAEVALLEQARRLLESDPARALALLDEHARRFPRGALGVEREVLSIDALMHASRRSEAEARAARLRASAPGNLYEQRLERIFGAKD